MEVFSKENGELTKEVHLYEAEENALTKQVENCDNLQQIALLAFI